MAVRGRSERKPSITRAATVEGAVAAQPDHRQRGAAGGGGERGDGVGEHRGRYAGFLRFGRAGFAPPPALGLHRAARALRLCRSRASIHCCGMLAMLLTA